MENLTHTLLGLTIAKAGLEAATPLATSTLVISSNLPDLDLLAYPRGDALSYIEYHRGLTHSFVGLIVLAGVLTLIMIFFDRKFRLKGDRFRRPARPTRIFLLALLGGFGHLLLDFTNSYGVRPLMPFDDRWFYGDFVFVADPWIWLILGFSVVWLTLRSKSRNRLRWSVAVFWIAVGALLSAIVALALRHPTAGLPPVSNTIRIIWFCGLGLILLGAFFGLGRDGPKYARWSLILLGIYYGGMWIGHQDALQHSATQPAAADVEASASWPEPANPLLWYSVQSADQKVYDRLTDLMPISLAGGQVSPAWDEQPSLSPEIADAIRRSKPGRAFLNFARFPTAQVVTRDDGYSVTLTDSRFGLTLKAELDRDLNVKSSEIQWQR
ncbi:MAG TPA: metal-dependent hydrolase [Blastocatellia bacterium]